MSLVAAYAGSVRRRHILPGFAPSLGVALAWIGLIVVLPLVGLVLKASGIGFAGLVTLLSSPRVQAAFAVSFGCAALAAVINAFGGLLVAWVLVRYRFPGRRLLDGLVDLPFALPTAVAGIALTSLYADNGWLGEPLAALGIQVAYAQAGIVVALTFIGLPFVVRAVQPVLTGLEREMEEAAITLGGSRWAIFRRVLLPPLLPALIAGTGLAFARAVGEYGSVIFIAGNRPGSTEILPLLIVTRLEQYDYVGASAIAAVMLVASLVLLLAFTGLERWVRLRHGG